MYCILQVAGCVYNGSPAMRPWSYGIEAGAAKRRFTVLTPEGPPLVSPPPQPTRRAALPQFGFACTCINAGKCPLGIPASHRSRSLRDFGYAKHIQRHPGCRESSHSQKPTRKSSDHATAGGVGTSPLPRLYGIPPLSHSRPLTNAHAYAHAHAHAHARTHA